MATKWCSTCDAERPISEFNKRKARPDGLDRQCRDCINAARRELRKKNPGILETERAWRKKNPDKWREYQQRDRENNGRRRAYDRKRRSTPEQRAARAARRRDLLYGFAEGEYDRLVEQQGGRCAICGEQPEKLFVDHCHNRGVVRELLCHGCNAAIGLMREDPERMARAIDYINKHRSE